MKKIKKKIISYLIEQYSDMFDQLDPDDIKITDQVDQFGWKIILVKGRRCSSITAVKIHDDNGSAQIYSF